MVGDWQYISRNETVGPWQGQGACPQHLELSSDPRLGFFEYFQFCEGHRRRASAGMAAGVPCQNSHPDKDGMGGQQCGIPMEDMPAYCKRCSIL
jgi:hypothetical protein